MKKITLLFPGQGSQYLGMGKNLYQKHENVRDLFNRASELLNMDMAALCFSESGEALSQTENTQPALLLVSLAFWQVFQQQTGLTPFALAGHSLGELTALTAAGCVTLEDGLRLARVRGLAMSRSDNNCGMIAVNKIAREELLKLCEADRDFGKEYVIANYNSPQQHVLSGRKTSLDKVTESLKIAGASVIPLRVSGAFHSPFMQDAIADFAAELNRIQIKSPTITVLSNVSALPHENADSIRAGLIKQLTSPVRWLESLQWLESQGSRFFVEAGPRDVLKKLVNYCLRDIEAFALDVAEDEQPLQSALAEALRALREKPAFLGKCLAVAVATRNNNWDEDAYQSGVVLPYQKLKEMHESHKAGLNPLGREEIATAIRLLDSIMVCKGASGEERNMRYQQIAAQTGINERLEQFLI